MCLLVGSAEQSALEQLLLVYRAPLELHYKDQVILLEPAAVNFQVDTTLMLPQVNQYRGNESFWTSFWDFLWLQPGQPNNVPLQATYSRERLQAFLEDVAARYDRPGSPPKANPDKLGFVPGEPGHALDVAAAVSLVDNSLRSPSDRTIILPVTEQTAIRPGFDTLSDLIRQDVSLFQFQGVVSLFLADLGTGRELDLNLTNLAPAEGRIAFSAMSTIKIPIMVSFFAHNDGGLTDEQNLLLKRSIDESQNTATDLLLKTIGRGDGYEGTRIRDGRYGAAGLAEYLHCRPAGYARGSFAANWHARELPQRYQHPAGSIQSDHGSRHGHPVGDDLPMLAGRRRADGGLSGPVYSRRMPRND
jgi:hypothetical protein